MSIKNKISVISILVGVMFLGVSANAMEKSKEIETEQKEDLFNILKKQETKQNIKEKENEKTNQGINEFKDGAESEEIEKLKNLGYGQTKEEQQEIKEIIEKLGFNNEAVSKYMEKRRIAFRAKDLNAQSLYFLLLNLVYSEKAQLDRNKFLIKNNKDEGDIYKVLENDEFKKNISFWVNSYGENSKSLVEENKLDNFKNIREYFENLVKKDIKNIFENVLERFKKYKCEFKEYDNYSEDKYSFYDAYNFEYGDEFFDFEELDEIIEKENEGIAKEGKIQIDKNLVISYVKDVLKKDKEKRDKIKTYRDLIKEAYMDCSSNLVDFKEHDKDCFIYEKSAIKKINAEYKELRNIFEIKQILERLKQKDKKNIKTSYTYFNIDSHMESFKELLIYKDIKRLEEIFKRNKCEEFVEVFKLFCDSGKIDQLIDKILELTKVKYVPGEFFEQAKKYFKEKLELYNRVLEIVKNIENIKENSTKEDEERLFKLLREGLGEETFKGLEKYLLNDIEKIKNNSAINFKDAMYIKTVEYLAKDNKLTFFDRLKEFLQNNFEEAKNLIDIKELLRNLKNLEGEPSITKLEDLIEKIKGRIDDEVINKLRELYGTNFLKEFFDSISVCDSESCIFGDLYCKLSAVIDSVHVEKVEADEMLEILNNILIATDGKTSEEELKNRINRFVAKIKYLFKNNFINININKLENFFKELSLSDLRIIVNRIKQEVEEIKGLDYFLYYLDYIICQEYESLKKEKKIKKIQGEIDSILKNLKEKKDENFLLEYENSSEFKELREKSEELYKLENNLSSNFLRLDISLSKNIYTGDYIIKKTPVFISSVGNGGRTQVTTSNI